MSIGARIIRSAEVRRMPWRNGGGETIELAAYPHDAEYGAFDWRGRLGPVGPGGALSSLPARESVGVGKRGDLRGRPIL